MCLQFIIMPIFKSRDNENRVHGKQISGKTLAGKSGTAKYKVE